MSSKTMKDFSFCVENILKNLDYILRKFNISAESNLNGVVKSIRSLIGMFRELEKKNRGLHRLIDNILNGLSEIVQECENVVNIVVVSVKDKKLQDYLQMFSELEKRCAKSIHSLSSVDVLSLELDECTEMRWWKSEYDKIREIVYYVVWLTYYLIWLVLYIMYRESPDMSEDIVRLVTARYGAIMLIHRALLK